MARSKANRRHKKLHLFTPGNAAREIVKRLERVEARSGCRSYQVYRDWLELVCACLESLPRHARSVVDTCQMAEDTPEAQALWQRCRNLYPVERGCFDLFTEALVILIEATDFPLQAWGDSGPGPDILGQIYMEYGCPSSWNGQFFTPWPIAKVLSHRLMQGIEDEIYARIKAALARHSCTDPLAFATGMAWLATPPEYRWDYFENYVLPVVAPLADPLLINDPCCGSGILSLAAASEIPQWAINAGLVRFSANDIDYGCIMMAKINFILYGLNSVSLKCALALSGPELAALPESVGLPYREAQEAYRNGNEEEVARIAGAVRQRNGSQPLLINQKVPRG